jgi:hypothetical protein
MPKERNTHNHHSPCTPHLFVEVLFEEGEEQEEPLLSGDTAVALL